MLGPKPFMIAGPVGQLETLYFPAKGKPIGVAVVNHPNPTQGGTNTNKVIQTTAKALANLGFHCYLPNLRGVGNSDGEHDFGHGEVEDALAVMQYAQAQHPDAHKVAVAGFSFGGYVTTFMANRIQADHVLLIGPAVGIYATPAPHLPHPQKALIIQGEVDDVVPLSNVSAWALPQKMPILVVADAGHFFHGRLVELGKHIERYFLV